MALKKTLRTLYYDPTLSYLQILKFLESKCNRYMGIWEETEWRLNLRITQYKNKGIGAMSDASSNSKKDTQKKKKCLNVNRSGGFRR
jgi:hypothetical protein